MIAPTATPSLSMRDGQKRAEPDPIALRSSASYRAPPGHRIWTVRRSSDRPPDAAPSRERIWLAAERSMNSARIP